ncbi:MAG: Ig-like domain-containing protein, partial [Lachnospiraceae bacterium]|nr:Ig-like domain-containing protein [Lachnospiraceae bacterium]
MKKIRILFLFLIFALTMCSPVHADRTSSNEPKSVQLKQGKQVTAYVIKGQTAILKAKTGLIWSSSRASVATVNQNGFVKALKKGKTLIKAKGSGIWYTCAIIVETPSINKTSLEMEIGDRRILEITGTKQKVKWRSGDTKVATVDASGWVVAKGQGSTKVTAFVGPKTYSCRIKVNPGTASPSGSESSYFRITYPDENNLQ